MFAYVFCNVCWYNAILRFIFYLVIELPTIVPVIDSGFRHPIDNHPEKHEVSKIPATKFSLS